jgi:hypothetical protein
MLSQRSKGCTLAWGLGEGVTSHHVKKKYSSLGSVKKGLGLLEGLFERLPQWKMDLRF